jgi:hypothetical protein
MEAHKGLQDCETVAAEASLLFRGLEVPWFVAQREAVRTINIIKVRWCGRTLFDV